MRQVLDQLVAQFIVVEKIIRSAKFIVALSAFFQAEQPSQKYADPSSTKKRECQDDGLELVIRSRREE